MRRSLALLTLLAAGAVAAPQPPCIAIRARVFDGTRMLDGMRTVVVRGGIIESVDAAASTCEQVLGADHFVLTPGFVDLRSSAGRPAFLNEESSEVTPTYAAVDALDARDAGFAEALASGVTTVAAAPGGRAVIGGLVGAVATDERVLTARIRRREAALILGMGTEPGMGNRMSRFQTPVGLHFRRPGNRMGTISEIERTVAMAKDGEGGSRLDPVRDALAGRLPTWWIARTQADILAALDLSRDLGLGRPVLVDPVEGHRVLERLAVEVRGVVVGPTYQIAHGFPEAWEGQDFRHALPALLHGAGIPLALATGPADPAGALRDRAILAMRHGLPADAALATITSVPADLLGLAPRGTIAPGAPADLVLFRGDPLSPASTVLATWVDGMPRRWDLDVAIPLVPPLIGASP